MRISLNIPLFFVHRFPQSIQLFLYRIFPELQKKLKEAVGVLEFKLRYGKIIVSGFDIKQVKIENREF